jgi:protein gp37
VNDHGTAIQWTHVPGYKGETWNPVTGCDRVSPGCAHCYALELASRLKRMGQPRYQKDGDPKTSGPGFGLTLHPDKLSDPMRWKAPRAVFVNSMSDLFHESIPSSFIDRMFAAMAMSPQHIFMCLTKRPERMAHYFSDGRPYQRIAYRCYKIHRFGSRARQIEHRLPGAWPIPNIWLGVTIENRRFVQRADLLRETPAAVRFISAEPLLGPLVPDRFTEDGHYFWADGSCSRDHGLVLKDIDWLISGGESGPRHRRFDPRWAIALRNRCEAEHVAFFHKQNGGAKPTSNGRLLDGRTYDQFPAVVA